MMHSAARLLFLASGLGFLTPAYGALLFTMSTTDGSVSLNGGPTQNTSFIVEALVTNTTLTTGFFGSDRYAVSQAWFTMPSAGLTRVLVNTALMVEIGLPGVGVPSAIVFSNPSNELQGVFGSPAIPAWNRISPLGPLTGLGAVGTGSLHITLVNATNVSIGSFDLANNINDARLQVAQVPEPSSMGLVAFAGLALAAFRARPSRRD